MRRPTTWRFSSPSSQEEEKTAENPPRYFGDEEDDMGFRGNWQGASASDSGAQDNDTNQIQFQYQSNQYSDDDDDWSDDPDVMNRQRSRSYGDAEDILSKPGYYESFSIDTADENQETTTSSNYNGLHHRTNTSGIHQRNLPYRLRGHSATPQTPQQPQYGYDFYRTPTPKRKLSHAAYTHFHPNNRILSFLHSQLLSCWKRRTFLKLCLVVGFCSYIILLIKTSFWLLDRAGVGFSKSSQQAQRHASIDSPSRSSFSGILLDGQQSIETLVAPQFSDSNSWSQQRLLMNKEAGDRSGQRSHQRKSHTRPKHSTWTFGSSEKVPWFATNQFSDETTPSLRLSRSQTASLEQLCGVHAKDASRLHPDRYPMDRSLNAKSARVLITGILSPLGFNLAMYLHHQCGVEVISGIDNMFPNTVENRLQLQDRLQLLHTNIPKLVKPIILPYIGLDPRLDKDKQSSANKVIGDMNKQPAEQNLLSLRPTHVVHLASYADEAFSEGSMDPSWRNSHSPYVEMETDQRNPMYQLRSSMVSMEQLVNSFKSLPADQRPHFVYASVAHKEDPTGANHAPIHKVTKKIDEILIETFKIPSIALRLPNGIFGSWGQAGSPVHDLMERAVAQWNSTSPAFPLLGQGSNDVSSKQLGMLHVDDAVEAIVAAMQYQATIPTSVDLSLDASTSVSSVASLVESFHPKPSRAERGLAATIKTSRLVPKVRSNPLSRVPIGQWAPRTSLYDGLLQTVAWHLNRDSPYEKTIETADHFLQRNDHVPCEADDWQCHKSKHYLPCLSECNTRDKCVPSIFDEIQELAINVTEGCNIILYTQSLGYNVKDIELQAEYMDDVDLADDEKLVCNFAFVPRESDLVSIVTSKVPNEQLVKFGIDLKAAKNSKDLKRAKLDGLNGRLLYHGWILLWVRDGTKELSVSDQSFLKMSPSKLFAPEVSHALFVEENFAVSPNLEDVEFLVSQMKRQSLPERTLKREVKTTTLLGQEIATKKKFRLPSEPKRRAAILFAPLRFPSGAHKELVNQFKYGDKKLTVNAAAKFMRYEWDKASVDREPADIRLQREYYERVPSYLNRNSELRSVMEPWYRYSMSHWVRSRWVVHDTHLEDSRLLRCDWYQEHVEWGTELDQLSFAHVMATRELKRRIGHMEPDDHVKPFIDQHPELRDMTDSYEWHPMETEVNKLYREPIQWSPEVPDHMKTVEEVVVDPNPHEPAPLYVRIMSERIMQASRKIWSKARAKQENQAKQDNKKKKKKP